MREQRVPEGLNLMPRILELTHTVSIAEYFEKIAYAWETHPHRIHPCHAEYLAQCTEYNACHTEYRAGYGPGRAHTCTALHVHTETSRNTALNGNAERHQILPNCNYADGHMFML